MPVQVVNNVSEIAEAARRGPVLMRKRKDESPVHTIIDEKEKTLSMRQSCWHEFFCPGITTSVRNAHCHNIQRRIYYARIYFEVEYLQHCIAFQKMAPRL